MSILKLKQVFGLVTILGAGLIAPAAMAQNVSHSYVNLTRSSVVSHIFVEQSLEGEFGQYSTSGRKDSEQGVVAYRDTQDWKGYGLGTQIGIEWMKFVQFTAGHTFVNMRHRDDSLESLSGSRLHAGARLVFLAPLFNLELGTGAQGSRLDYQKQLENATFHGSGLYQEIAVNYFTSSRISVFCRGKVAREHLARTGGDSSVKDMDTATTQLGAGFRIWM